MFLEPFTNSKFQNFQLTKHSRKWLRLRVWESFIFEFVPLRLGFTPSCNNPKSSFSSPVLHASNNLQSWCIRTVLPVRLFFFSIEFSENILILDWNVAIWEFLSEKAHGQKEDGPKSENWTVIFWILPSIKLYLSTSSFRTFFAFSRRSGSMKTCHRSFNWYDSGSEIQIHFLILIQWISLEYLIAWVPYP